MFLPEGYTSPKSTGGYTKLNDGDTKLRILSKPIIGWEDWVDQRPVRFDFYSKPTKPHDETKPVRHFWAMIVWNYSTEQIEVFHITQASIRKEIENLNNSEDWGAPFFYDIRIVKKGEGMKTEYSVTPIPHKPLPSNVKEEFQKKPCNLEALFWNQDPFAPGQSSYTPGVFSREDLPKKVEKAPVVRYPTKDDVSILNAILEKCTEASRDSLLKDFPYKSFQAMPLEEFNEFVKKCRDVMEMTGGK